MDVDFVIFMTTLYHDAFCPQSRFVRLVLGELGITPTLVEERVWERRRDFLALNPAGTTPVFIEQQDLPLPGASVIAEYLDETRGLGMGDRRLLPDQPGERAEVRRLLGEQGSEPVGGDATAFAALINNELKKYRTLLQSAGITQAAPQ